MATDELERIRWPGSGSNPTGVTPFGFYDIDPDFIQEAPRAADWAARRLGFPILDVELVDIDFYAYFEESILEYTNQVNMFNIRQNLDILKGTSTSNNVSQRLLGGSGVATFVRLAKAYGSEAGSGGEIDWHYQGIRIKSGCQNYDLQSLYDSGDFIDNGCIITGSDEKAIIDCLASQSACLPAEADDPLISRPKNCPPDTASVDDCTGSISDCSNRIEIKRIFHFLPPAIDRAYLATAGGGGGTVGVTAGQGTDVFDAGFASGAPGAGGTGFFGGLGLHYTVFPVYDILAKTQHVEFWDNTVRSAFTFELKNNKLRLFPVPQRDFNLFFQYIIEEDRDNAAAFGQKLPDGTYENLNRDNKVSDMSNVPYKLIPYTKLNDVARQWIRKYFLAICKESLGLIRQKYESIPIPDGDVQLNGAELISQGQTEKEALIEQLRTDLEETDRTRQMEKASQEGEYLQNSLKYIPTPNGDIWIA